MEFKPINIIHVLIIWQSLLVAIVLATPRYNKNKGNKFLSLLLLTLSVHFVYNILYTNGLYLHVLPPYSCCFGFLYGPLFFLYIRFHLKKDVIFRPLYWLHFSPDLAILILTSLGLSVCRYAGILIFPVMLTYAIFSFREISIYAKTIRHVSSKSIAFEIKWLKTINILMLVIVLLNMLQSKIPFISFSNFEFSMEVVVQLGLLLFVSMINYQGLKKPNSFQQISDLDISISKSVETKNTLATIDKKSLDELRDRLEKYMENEEPYLNPDLNINILAGALEVSEKTLSQTINHIIGTNFSDYINSYRIESARSKLEHNIGKELSIKEIMYDVGFNSRSVFNSAFKKKTGLTPSEYQIAKNNL